MSAILKIREHIAKLPSGEPFSSSSLWHLASTDNVRKILSRLVEAGEIERVGRGMFVKPKHIKGLGMALPTLMEIAAALSQSTGETITIHGAEAARQLQFTTQVPMKIVFYTSGNSRTLKYANRTITLKHVSPSKLIAANTLAGVVLCALLYLGRENVTVDTINIISKRITKDDFARVIKLTNKMPAWLADMFYLYQKGASDE